jgi:AcrR family transcriptional regulator
MRCVAEVGYTRATIREIARVANVTSASLYNYFPNKSELIKATIAARADAAIPRLRRAADGPGDIIDRIEAVLSECGNLMRQYPDLAAFEWAIRAEPFLSPGKSPGESPGESPGKSPGESPGDRDAIEDSDPELGAATGGPGFETFRSIIEGLVEEASRNGDLGPGPDPRSAVEAIYALIYGLTELAAALPSEDYHAALSSAKVMVRGELFGSNRPLSP